MKKIIVVFLMVSILLTACNSDDVPELIAPARSIDAYYTLSKGTINNQQINDGYIIPASESVFFQCDGQAFDVKYRPGDVVKKGDVIISLNEGIDVQVAEIESQISQYQTISDYYVTQHAQDIEEMKRILSTKSGMDYELYALDVQYQELQYERFDQQRIDEYADLQAQYADLLLKQANSSITAPCDGTIAFSAAEYEGQYVSKNNLALVIADESQKIVQFKYNEESYYESLDDFYIQIGDTKYTDFSFIEYSDEELEYNSTFGYDLYSRVVINDLPDDVEFGTYCAIYEVTDTAENVLYAPNESIFFDSSSMTHYCLLLNDDGTQERVVIDKGTETKYYTEILSGLSEGQKIYMAEDLASWSSEKITTEVMLGDYTSTMQFSGAYKDAMIREDLIVEYPGTVSEIYLDVTSNVYVEEGTELFSLIPYVDESVYQQAKLDYENAVANYDTSIENYDSQIEAKQEQVNNATNTIDETLAQYELDTLINGRDDFVAGLDENLAKLEKNFNIYEACMTGEPVVITAPTSGTLFIDITLVKAEIGKDQVIGSICDQESYMCYVNDYNELEDSNGFLKYGNSVTIISDGGSLTTTGKVYGSSQLIEDKNISEISIRLDNDIESININSLNASVTVNEIEISNVTIIDKSYIYSDDDEVNPQRYVILQVGDYYVRRNIETARVSLGDEQYVWVKSGLNPGDVCIKF